MKNLRGFHFALIIVLLFTLLVGCTSSKESTSNNSNDNTSSTNKTDAGKTSEYRIVRSKDSRALPTKDMLWTKNFEKIAPSNVKINWEDMPGESADEKVNLMLASNDLPDAFMQTLNTTTVMNNVKNGLFLPLEDYIDDMPNFSKVLKQRPEYKAQITAPDGHIYGLPYIEEMFGLVSNQGILSIYKPWLDKFGLPMPTTIDEYRNALKTFVDQDANGNGKKDEIGLALANKDASSGFGSWRNNSDFGQFFGLWGQADRGDSMVPDENGKITSTATTQAYKTGIKYLNEMFKEHLIDPEFAITDGPMLSAKMRNEEVIVGSVINFSIIDLLPKEIADDYVPVPYLKGPEGEYGTRENISEMHNPVAFVITNKVKDPKPLLAWIDTMYDPEWSVQTNWGPLGYVYEKNDKGVMVWGELKDGFDTFNDMRARNTISGGTPIAILREYYDTVVEYPQDAQDLYNDMKAVGFVDKHLDDPYIPHTLFFESDKAERMSVLSPQIYGLIDTNRRKWITDGGVDQEWDAYVKELDKAGWSEFIGYVQEAYDRYKQNQ